MDLGDFPCWGRIPEGSGGFLVLGRIHEGFGDFPWDVTPKSWDLGCGSIPGWQRDPLKPHCFKLGRQLIMLIKNDNELS